MKNTKNFTRLALMIALLIVLGLTPLGFIDVPPVSITTMHIPVIVGSIVLGYKYGSVLGLSFGIFSLLRAILRPMPTAYMFSMVLSGKPLESFILCVAPRILLGIIPGVLYTAFKKLHISERISVGITAIISTVIHTFSVLSLMMLFFGATNIAKIFAAIISVNGSLEIIAAAVISVAVCNPLIKLFKRTDLSA
ncbi:MAG: ECF transporter S component [Clostridia bacterium]|nr:ECF transporter S component [Clostridia bacterium]